MIDAQGYDDLVAAIYEAGADMRRWPETLRQIARALDARTVMLRTLGRSADAGWDVTPDIDPEVHGRYAAHYHDINPLWRPASALPLGSVRTDAMLVPRADFVRTEFFNDFLRPQDLGSMLGATAWKDAAHLCVASVQRTRAFSDEEVALYRRLVPHLQSALRLNLKLARLEMRCTASAAALDRVDQPTLLVDAACRVLFANRTAEALFANGSGLRLVARRLEASRAAESAKLQALVAICGSPGIECPAAALSLSRDRGAAPLSLSILPLRTHAPTFELAARPVAVIFIDDGDRAPAPAIGERIRCRYGLSPKETAFALEVLKGEGLKACATRLGISHATARTHLAHIFQKTGARRQAELVRLLMQA